jgi:hypothetical protein
MAWGGGLENLEVAWNGSGLLAVWEEPDLR